MLAAGYVDATVPDTSLSLSNPMLPNGHPSVIMSLIDPAVSEDQK